MCAIKRKPLQSCLFFFFFTSSFGGVARLVVSQATERLAVENNLQQKIAQRHAFFTLKNNVFTNGHYIKKIYLRKISNNSHSRRQSHLHDRTESKVTSFWGTFRVELPFFHNSTEAKERTRLTCFPLEPGQLFFEMTEDWADYPWGGNNVEGRLTSFPSFVSRECRAEKLEWQALTSPIFHSGR